jgi:hypothetical protein
MTKDEALKLALEYIETNAHERRHVRWAIKDALAQREQDGKCKLCVDGCIACDAKAQPVQLVSWTGNGSDERRDIEAPTGFFYQVDERTQPEERNFCQRCGKRTAIADLITIHTCTPPQIDPNKWAFDHGLEST